VHNKKEHNMGSTMTMAVNECDAGAIDSAAPATFVERRRGPRYQFTATVELVDLKSRTRVQARTSDLSGGGCYVDTTSPLPVDMTVKMRLTRENLSFSVEAKVAYSLPGMGMGLAFTSADPEQVAVLKRWIGELSGELLPELSATESAGPIRVAKGSKHGPSYVLGTLIFELMRQGVLSSEKAKVMLDQLL
jgi:PilZ domain